MTYFKYDCLLCQQLILVEENYRDPNKPDPSYECPSCHYNTPRENWETISVKERQDLIKKHAKIRDKKIFDKFRQDIEA